jgi:hypothetical protein
MPSPLAPLLFAAWLAGQAPPADPQAELAAALRALVVSSLPDPLYEKRIDWGKTARVQRQRWKGQGLNVRPYLVEVERNDGVWRKVRVTAENPGTLVCRVRDLRQPEKGRATFTVFLSFDARVHYDQQTWENGVRLYAGSARARLRVHLTLGCELTTRVERGGGWLPDTVIRLRVVTSELAYDHPVVEHLPGLGGTAARLLGEALLSGWRQWRPSLERDLVARVNAAIVRAADTRELRLGLGGLLAKP